MTADLASSLVATADTPVPAWVTRLDTRLGELSYPIFLCHLPVLAWVVWAGLAPEKGPEMLIFGTLLANGVGLEIHLVSELPLVHLRNQVRGQPRSGTPAN